MKNKNNNDLLLFYQWNCSKQLLINNNTNISSNSNYCNNTLNDVIININSMDNTFIIKTIVNFSLEINNTVHPNCIFQKS